MPKYRKENYFDSRRNAVVFHCVELSAKISIMLERAIYTTISVLYQDISIWRRTKQH
jgi:hypothetical protein